MNQNTTVYLCEDTLEGIFTAIYQAWADGTSHTDVRLQSDADTLSFFEEYKTVTTDTILADKVVHSIKHKLSDQVYYHVFRATLSSDPTKASHIYHFLQKAFKYGPNIIHQLNDDDVCKIFELTRFISNEAHRYLEFVRFEELRNGVLVSRINPKGNVVPIIAEHFADRLHCENWIILDTNREIAAVHSAHHGYILTTQISEDQLLHFSTQSDNEQIYKDLWNTFFHTIAIEERKNTDLQRNMMPLRYRKYMDVENR